MGKAAALVFLIVVLIAVGCSFVGSMMAAARAVKRKRWQNAIQQARWEPYTRVLGPNEVEVSVCRVARLGGRHEVLPGSAFAPTRIQITDVGDPALIEALSKAQQQADTNNTLGTE